MKRCKLLLFIFSIFFIMPMFVCAHGGKISIWQGSSTDQTNQYYYSDSNIYELWDSTNGERIFCLDHGLHACTNYTYYYDSTIYEGPACAFTDYGWYYDGDENNGSDKGTERLHWKIRFIQYYNSSSFSCEKYKKVSGYCSSNNKSAIDDTGASIGISKVNDSFYIYDNYYVMELKVSKSGSVSKYTPTISSNYNSNILVTTSKTSNDNVLNTETDSSNLFVKIPISLVTDKYDLNINVSSKYSTTCNYKIPGLDAYYTTTSTCQRISYITWKNGSNTKEFTKGANINLSANSITGKIKITKVDAKTSLALEGVKFKLYSSSGEEAKYVDGNLVGELVTDSNGEIVIDNLYRDTYILKEISNLPQYLKLTEDINIKLDSDYEEVNISNEPIIIKISKQDITSHKELSSAELVLNDEEGNVIKKITTGEEPTSFYISPGTYTLTETVAPKGYDKLSTSFKFKVNSDGAIELLDTNSKYFGKSEDVIILYNDVEKVIVPDTLSNKSIIIIFVGVSILFGGVYIVVKTLKYNGNIK